MTGTAGLPAPSPLPVIAAQNGTELGTACLARWYCNGSFSRSLFRIAAVSQILFHSCGSASGPGFVLLVSASSATSAIPWWIRVWASFSPFCKAFACLPQPKPMARCECVYVCSSDCFALRMESCDVWIRNVSRDIPAKARPVQSPSRLGECTEYVLSI